MLNDLLGSKHGYLFYRNSAIFCKATNENIYYKLENGRRGGSFKQIRAKLLLEQNLFRPHTISLLVFAKKKNPHTGSNWVKRKKKCINFQLC